MVGDTGIACTRDPPAGRRSQTRIATQRRNLRGVVVWWAILELNQWPPACQAGTATSKNNKLQTCNPDVTPSFVEEIRSLQRAIRRHRLLVWLPIGRVAPHVFKAPVSRRFG